MTTRCDVRIKKLPPQLFLDSYIRKFSVLIRQIISEMKFSSKYIFRRSENNNIYPRAFCRKYGGWWITGAHK